MSEESFDNDRTESFVPLTKGTKIGHYKIVSKIGAGGMGEVYLAEDRELKRKVALKFLPYQFISDETAKARFKREAQAAAKLNHPNIVTIYEVSEYQNRPFFAMECCEGKPLRDIIKEKELSIEESVNLAIQICKGLEKAHDAGIVHRDIKPSNIIVDSDGRAKLLDFGLATVQGTEKLTQTGSTLGTIGYMSPEQIEAKEIDHRSDLFSLGVVLYEMIAGRPPFKGDTEAGTLNAILNNSAEPLSRYKSGVSDELHRIVSKLLEKDTELRYQSAAGVISDLKRLTANSKTTATKLKHDWWNKYVVSGAILVLIIILLVIKPWKFEVSTTHDVFAQENKLAIMYFDNLADPTDSLGLGEITTNLLITDLSESKYVQIVSSQRLYDVLKQLGKEDEKKIDRNMATQIARKTNSKWMLLGSILKVKPNIILTSQLVEVETGNAIASQRIDGTKDDDIFALVDKLTSEIGSDLSIPENIDQHQDVTIANVTTQSPEAYRYYIDGINLYMKHYWTDAERSFKKALEYDSTFAMTLLALARIYFYKNDDPNAKYWINKTKQFSDNVSIREKLYIDIFDARIEGNYERALYELEKLLKIYPEDKDAHIIIGLIKRMETNDPIGAVADFKKAIELDPYSKESYNQLAYLYDELGQFEKAIWAINKYIDLVPDEANPYDTKGEILALNGKLDEAIVSYKKAIEIKSDFSITSLANLYLFKQEYSIADSLYRTKLLSSDSRVRADGRLLLTRSTIYQGKFKEAIRLLDVGIETDKMELGEGIEVAIKLGIKGIVKNQFGNTNEAINDITKSLAILEEGKQSGEPIMLYKALLALCYFKEGDNNKAESNMIEAEKLAKQYGAPYDLGYWLWKGIIALEHSKYDSAVVYLQKLCDGYPYFFPPQYYLGQSYLETNRLGDAVEILENTMNKYDQTRVVWPFLSVLVHYQLGKSYEASGWDDKAIEQYETFLDIWKNADEGIEAIDDAKARLAKLKSST